MCFLVCVRLYLIKSLTLYAICHHIFYTRMVTIYFHSCHYLFDYIFILLVSAQSFSSFLSLLLIWLLNKYVFSSWLRFFIALSHRTFILGWFFKCVAVAVHYFSFFLLIRSSTFTKFVITYRDMYIVRSTHTPQHTLMETICLCVRNPSSSFALRIIRACKIK